MSKASETPETIRCERLMHVANRHPCFGGGPNMNRGRIHLPVSPACNM